jgi:hypothetical protein
MQRGMSIGGLQKGSARAKGGQNCRLRRPLRASRAAKVVGGSHMRSHQAPVHYSRRPQNPTFHAVGVAQRVERVLHAGGSGADVGDHHRSCCVADEAVA